jgi:hypothetical protein
VVLALSWGGATIGFEIAQALGAPLDVVLAREIGVPWQPELALGAVTDGANPDSFIDRALATRLDVSENYIRTETERQLQEFERRRNSYCAARPPTEIAGRRAIVVDDGIATGATMRVAACFRIAASSPGRGSPIDPGFTGRARRFATMIPPVSQIGNAENSHRRNDRQVAPVPARNDLAGDGDGEHCGERQIGRDGKPCPHQCRDQTGYTSEQPHAPSRASGKSRMGAAWSSSGSR